MIFHLFSSSYLKKDGEKVSVPVICVSYIAIYDWHWFGLSTWVCEKVASVLGLGGGFRQVLWFPPLLTTGYSLSDLSWPTAFSHKKLFLPSKFGKPLRSTTACICKLTFCLNSAKCWFCSLGPIVKFAHCQQWWSLVFVLLSIVGNGQILQWDLMSKINILRSWDKKYVYT